MLIDTYYRTSILNKNIIISVLCSFLLLASCQQKEDLETSTIIEGKEINANFTVKYATLSIPTLRTQTMSEKAIQDIELLVFVNGAYQYTVTGKSVSTSSENVTFNALVYSTVSPVTIFLLANGASLLANSPSLVIGESENAVALKLNSTFSASGMSGYFPMFGSYSFPSGLNALVANNITGIHFLRSLARVDVKADAVSSNFQLASIQAFRANSLAQLIPENRLSTTAITPSVPTESSATINTTVIAPTTTATSSESQLYLPESLTNQVSQATCVVIGGYYNGSSTLSYYRMDFDSDIAGHPFGQILRNFQYTFTIQSVSDAGYSTAESAANNPPSGGISSSIVVWDSNTTNMITDGVFHLGIAKNSILIGSALGAINTSLIDANTDYTLQWANSTGVGTGTAETSLNNGTFSVQQLNGGTSIQVTALTANALNTDVVYYILLRSTSNSNLSLLVTIRQTAFGVTPGSITISASGGKGYALVKSNASAWGTISNQSWFSTTTATADTLKWSATPNPGTTIRTGNLLVNNLNGEQVSVPFQQKIPNKTVLNVYSLQGGYAYLGGDAVVSSAGVRAQGLKGILTNAANFSLSGKVNCDGFKFTARTGQITATVLANINILYVNLPGAVGDVTAAEATAAVTWLNGDSKRVLIVGCDLNTNANLLTALGITNISYYTDTPAYPMQFNANTQYFSNTGPFTVYPDKPIVNPFSFRNYDAIYSEINTTTHSAITPILRGSYGHSLLGIDYTRKVIYVGEIDLFSAEGAGNNPTTNNYIQNITGVINSDASRLIANVWAWAANTALGVTP